MKHYFVSYEFYIDSSKLPGDISEFNAKVTKSGTTIISTGSAGFIDIDDVKRELEYHIANEYGQYESDMAKAIAEHVEAKNIKVLALNVL